MIGAGVRRTSILAVAHHLITPVLEKEATAISADLYIGHCLASLLPTIVAANNNRGRVGFDAEDFHSGEAPNEGPGRLDNAIAEALQHRLLRRCDYLTASSPLIAEAYRTTYGVDAVPVLNVFPLSEAVEPQPPSGRPSFYWFSQTIGSGRGLEEFIEILRQTELDVRLDLRGHVAESYKRELKELVNCSPIELRFLPPDVPHSMVCNAAGYTAGLGLEANEPVNRNLCLTNKAFTYILAGTPVILSRTRAQDKLGGELGDACLMIDLGSPRESALTLTSWLANSDRQSKARVESFRLGRERFNWDREKDILLKQVETVLTGQSKRKQD